MLIRFSTGFKIKTKLNPTWGYVHGERGKGSVEEAQNEEERNDRGEGVPNEGCDHVRQDRGTERAEGKFRRSAEGEWRRSR